MIFLANENFPKTSFTILNTAGIDIKHVGETNPSIADDEVMNLAWNEKRIFLTFDRDYGDLVFRQGYRSLGIIYLRIQKFEPDFPAQIMIGLLKNSEISLSGYFTVVDEGKLRQRKI